MRMGVNAPEAQNKFAKGITILLLFQLILKSLAQGCVDIRMPDQGSVS